MSDQVPSSSARQVEPPSGWIIALWLLAIILTIAGPIMVGAGVNADDVQAGQVLYTFGSGAITAGLVGILIALGISALRASASSRT